MDISSSVTSHPSIHLSSLKKKNTSIIELRSSNVQKPVSPLLAAIFPTRPDPTQTGQIRPDPYLHAMQTRERKKRKEEQRRTPKRMHKTRPATPSFSIIINSPSCAPLCLLRALRSPSPSRRIIVAAAGLGGSTIPGARATDAASWWRSSLLL